jgi:alkylation response protein AidB-like acyl-CoA dehydrogenase
MHFGFDDDQIAVRDAVASLLDKRCDAASLQQAWNAGSASPLLPLWEELAGLGVQGLLAPESSGGSGLDWVTMALVLAESGRAALPLPVLETAAVAVPAFVSAGDPAGLLASVLNGSLAVSVVSRSGLAPAAGVAGAFIADGPDGAMVYRRSEVALDPVKSVDRTRDLARVSPIGVGTPLGPLPVEQWCALGAAAQLVGLGRALVRMTVNYVKERRQFGVAVGSFQAVKHQIANAHLAIEFAAPPVWAAAHLCNKPVAGSDSTDLLRATSMAKALASDAASLAAKVALQCHGAMGYTDDYPLHFWLKRVWCLAAAHGSSAEHTSKVATALGI